MEHKIFSSFTKVVDAAQGIVEHIVAVMGNMDLGGDIIHPGAFTKTISERGLKVRCLDHHQTDSVLRALGKPLAMKEIGRDELPAELLQKFPEAVGGLWVKTQYNLNTQAGHDAFQHIAAGDVDEYSIGYDALDSDYAKVKIGGVTKTVRNLRTIKLYEYSPVLFGMNPATTTISAKDAADTDTADTPPPDVPETPDAPKSVNLSQAVSDVMRSFEMQYNPPGMMGMYWVREVWDDYLVTMCCADHSETQFFQVPYTRDGDNIVFAPRAEWVEGEYVFVPMAEASGEMSKALKAGRVQARRNVERLQRIMDELMALMEDAGLMDEPDDDGDSTDKTKEAGPVTPPTDEASQIQIEIEKLKLLEV